jgi:PleD family two-component response regulator
MTPVEHANDRAALLVVDDDEMTRDVLTRRLQRIGHAVVAARDGAQALELIGQQSFDAVLLDIKMPGLTGFDVLKKIRQTRSVTDLPVLMVTSSDDSDSVVEALELGANDYIMKPLDFPVALARIRTQLLLRRVVVALEEANRKLERLSFLDGLTNIANRRRFDEYLALEWRRARRSWPSACGPAWPRSRSRTRSRASPRTSRSASAWPRWSPAAKARPRGSSARPTRRSTRRNARAGTAWRSSARPPPRRPEPAS